MQEEFNDIMSKLGENARFALQKADFYAKRYNNGYMSTEHLLLGIAAQDAATGAMLLAGAGVTIDDLEKSINATAVEVPGSQMAMMSLSEAAVLTLRIAMNFVKDQGLDVLGTEHLLYALVSQPNSRAALMLEGLNVDLDSLAEEIEELTAKQADEAKNDKKRAEFKKAPQLKWLRKYGEDLTALAAEGKLDAVVGRDKEIERLAQILGRRKKNNPVLIGEPGVGKSAIAEGLAIKIAKREVSRTLRNKRIIRYIYVKYIIKTA